MPHYQFNKKGPAFTEDRAAWAWLHQVSKAALFDIVIDCARRDAGDEELDGHALVAALNAMFEPVAIVRGDKMPR